MTLLNYLLTDDAVYVLTDTVVSDPDDLSPLTFTTKVHALPHLQALICGTGHVQLILEWVATIQLALPARDIVDLDASTPTRLRRLFARHAEQQTGGRDITTTLYHFGFDTRARRLTGFAYRSTEHFESEPLPQGFGFKPAPEGPIDSARIKNLPKDLIALAKRQKAQDETTDLARRVVVGGQLLFHVMQRVPGPRNSLTVHTSAAICHSFPDFEDMYAQVSVKRPPEEEIP